MKKISLVIAVAVCFVITMFAPSAPAQVECPAGYVCTDANKVPDQVPLTRTLLKAYALNKVSWLYGYVSSPSISGNTYFQVNYPFADGDTEKMSAIVSTNSFKFSGLPQDTYSSGIAYYGQFSAPDGSTYTTALFYGWTNFNLVQSGTNWVVPGYARNIELGMNEVIPFQIPGLKSAWMEIKDVNGNNRYYDFNNEAKVNTKYGFLMLSKEHLNHNGRLYVILSDGNRVVYDLSSGEKLPAVSTGTVLKASVAGVRTVLDQTQIVLQEGDGLVRAKYSIEKSSVISVRFPPALAKYPVKVCFIGAATFAANPAAEWKECNPAVEPVEYIAESADIWIRFEYAEPEIMPVNSGGKG